MSASILVAPGVYLRQSIVHPCYRVGELGLQTHVEGVGTEALAANFRGGDSVGRLACDYELTPGQVEAALRWELWTRRQRVRLVEKAWRRK